MYYDLCIPYSTSPTDLQRTLSFLVERKSSQNPAPKTNHTILTKSNPPNSILLCGSNFPPPTPQQHHQPQTTPTINQTPHPPYATNRSPPAPHPSNPPTIHPLRPPQRKTISPPTNLRHRRPPTHQRENTPPRDLRARCRSYIPRPLRAMALPLPSQNVRLSHKTRGLL